MEELRGLVWEGFLVLKTWMIVDNVFDNRKRVREGVKVSWRGHKRSVEGIVCWWLYHDGRHKDRCLRRYFRCGKDVCRVCHWEVEVIFRWFWAFEEVFGCRRLIDKLSSFWCWSVDWMIVFNFEWIILCMIICFEVIYCVYYLVYYYDLVYCYYISANNDYQTAQQVDQQSPLH